MFAPVSDRADFLRRESREYEVRILCLPSQRLGFDQSEPQHVFMVFDAVAPLGEDRAFDLPDLCENLLARSEAQMGKRGRDAGSRPGCEQWV